MQTQTLRPKGAIEYEKYLFKSAKQLDLLPCRNSPIGPGDLYLAERNTGLQLLTCKQVNNGVIHPVESGAYAFNENECLKVVPI